VDDDVEEVLNDVEVLEDVDDVLVDCDVLVLELVLEVEVD
jgi:hypothetical protein